MAWLFGSGKRTPTGQSEFKAARDRQISNLHERLPGLQQKSMDHSLYEVQIRTPPDGKMVMLRVFLPTKFPAERPVLQLLSQVSHPWVNQYMQVVGHPDLHGWDASSPPLVGEIVSTVIREFGRDNPSGSPSGREQDRSSRGGHRAQPAISAFSTNPLHDGGFGGMVGEAGDGQGRADVNISDAPTQAQQRGREQRPQKVSRRQPKHHTPIPPTPNKFDELQDMPTAQLSRLLEDDVARQALLLGMTSVVGMQDLRTDVRKGNMETAQSTLSKQETARVLREECQRMRLTLKELQTSYEGKTHGRNKNMGGTADQVILKQVKHASKTADVSSERLASDFLEKRLPAQEFLEEFVRERQRYHMLAAKIECMKRDIRF